MVVQYQKMKINASNVMIIAIALIWIQVDVCQMMKISKDKIYYYRCNSTNKEGTACEICLEGFILNENGIYVDEIHCIDKKDDKCQRCQNDEKGMFCLNKYFGCEEIYYKGCLECNNIFDLFACIKCLEGYELNQNGKCIEIEDI